MSQAEFAQMAGVSQATVSRWESGELEPGQSELGKIRQDIKNRQIPWRDEWFFEANPEKHVISSPTFPTKPSREEAEQAVRTLIRWAGDNPERKSLVETPKRVVKAFEEFFGGYGQKVENLLDRVFEADGYDDLVLVRDISFHTHCEHHLAPFFGKAHIGYYPSNGILGLSKLARVVELFARRLQTQERLTYQIGEALFAHIKPRGAAVMLEAEHLCMAMRGIKKQGALTLTTHFTGCFKDEPGQQAKFLNLVGRARD